MLEKKFKIKNIGDGVIEYTNSSLTFYLSNKDNEFVVDVFDSKLKTMMKLFWKINLLIQKKILWIIF